MTESEIKKITRDAIKEYFSDKLDAEVAKQIRSNSSRTHAEMISIIRDAMVTVHRFMFL